MGERRHKTSINFLQLPIFSSSKQISKQYEHVIFYKDKNIEKQVLVKGGLLNNFHRKLLLSLEVIYLKQNKDFESKEVKTTYGQLSTLLNIEKTNNTRILESIRDLKSIVIYSDIKVKGKGVIQGKEEGFNIIDNYSIQYTQNTQNKKRRYVDYISIKFNDWHIENLKQRYYRIINFELVKKLETKSIRLFDFINLHAYYKEGESYKQKTKLRIKYTDLADYLLLTHRKELSLVRQQLSGQLEDLKSKGVLKDYNFEKELFDIFIYLKLSKSINLWTQYTAKISDLDNIKKLTPIQYRLEEYGLSTEQVEKITEEYSENFIKDKLKQTQYMFKYTNKVKGLASYLYNSIIQDWKEQLYDDYKQEQKQHELQLLTAQKNKEHEKIVEKYEKYVHDTCINYYKNKISDKDKEQIDEEVQEKLESNTFIQTNKSIKELYEQSTISKVIQERSKELSEFHLLSFQNWQKEQS